MIRHHRHIHRLADIRLRIHRDRTCAVRADPKDFVIVVARVIHIFADRDDADSGSCLVVRIPEYDRAVGFDLNQITQRPLLRGTHNAPRDEVVGNPFGKLTVARILL